MSTRQITEPIIKFFRPIMPHVTFIMIMLYLLGIGLAMWSTQAVLTQPSDSAYRAQQKLQFTQSSFDEDAIEKVKALREDLSNNELDIQSERATPFQ